MMMQGDACNLGIFILNNAGSPVTPEDVRDVEITMGQLRKTYAGSQLYYQDGRWMFPLTQQETFRFRPVADGEHGHRAAVIFRGKGKLHAAQLLQLRGA